MEPVSKTQQALALLRANPQRSAYSAAKEVGLSAWVVQRALKALRQKAAEV